MFEFVRKHTKILQFILFLLIFPSFVLFGIQGYEQMINKEPPVASIAGVGVTQSEWDQTHRNEIERLRTVMPNLDAKAFDAPEAKQATLERIVRERVLRASVQSQNLEVSERKVALELQANPTLARLKKADGKLDMDAFRQQFGAQGIAPDQLFAQVQKDMAARQVIAPVTQSGVSTQFLVDRALNAFFETREIQILRFKPSAYSAQVPVNDAALEAYYQKQQARYTTTERADVEFIVLDEEHVRKQISVSEADAKSYYEQNQQRLSGDEERKASHILITATSSAGTSERAEAKNKATALLAQIRKNPNNFAALAKQHSQDPGSASKGGDLGFFARAAMVKPFSDAAFTLKKGEVSDVVESDFGYHIIQLNDIKSPKSRSFAEMRTEIETEIKKQLLSKKFAEMADQLSNLVYEQADSLKPAAEKLGLLTRTATGLTRQSAGNTTILNNAKLLNAIFSADSTQNKRNTEAVEVGVNQVVAARMVKHYPARTPPLAEIKPQISLAYVAENSADLARKDGETKLTSLKQSPPALMTGFEAAQSISREKDGGNARTLINAALTAPSNNLPAYTGVSLGTDGYAIVRVNKILPRSAPEPTRQAQERLQFTQALTMAETQAFYKYLQQLTKTTVATAPQKP